MKLSQIIAAALNTNSLRGYKLREKVAAIVNAPPSTKYSFGSDALAEGWNNFQAICQNKTKSPTP